MPEHIILSFFALGIAFQVLNILRGKLQRNNIMALIAMSVFSFLTVATNHKAFNNLAFQIMSFCIVFCGLFAIFFKKQILTKINERILLFYTIIFWYAVISFIGPVNTFLFWPMWIALSPTFAVLYAAFTHEKFNFSIKLLLYAWYLIILFSLGWIVHGVLFIQMLNNNQLSSISPLDAFFYGGSFLFLICNYIYLFELLPIKGKTQSWASAVEDWRKHLNLLVSKTSNQQIPFKESISIVVISTAIFTLNYIFNFVAPGVLISFTLLIMSIRNNQHVKTTKY